MLLQIEAALPSNMLHVLDKYPMHNEILLITLDEYRHLTIKRTAFVILHQSRDHCVPSASSLNRSIDCLEQL